MAVAPVTETVTIRVERFRRWLPQLIAATAAVGETTPEAMLGPSRRMWLVELRRAYAVAARDVMHKSWPQISRALGRGEHTGTRFSYFVAHEQVKTDPEFRHLVDLVLAIAREIAGRPQPTLDVEPELPL